MATLPPSRRSSHTSTRPLSLRRSNSNTSPISPSFEEPQGLSLADELAHLDASDSDTPLPDSSLSQSRNPTPPRPRRTRRRSSLIRHIALDEPPEGYTPSELSYELSTALDAQLSQIEALARPLAPLEEEEDIFTRVERLLQLPSEERLSAPTTRLCTAHVAIARFVDESSSVLAGWSAALFAPFYWTRTLELSEEDVDFVLDVLSQLAGSIPRPDDVSIHALRVAGAELGTTLAGLSDSLSVARQVEDTARRRLRSALEMVGVLKREERIREEGEVYIARGDWDRRIRKREASRTCREVVSGFERACEGFENKFRDEGLVL